MADAPVSPSSHAANPGREPAATGHGVHEQAVPAHPVADEPATDADGNDATGLFPHHGKYNQFLPQLCQVCQVPMFFTEPGDPTQIAFRETTYHGMKYHFCSDHCKGIFEHEPRKYAQAWLPVHQIYQGNCYPEDINPASPGDSPVREVLRYYGVEGGQDNGEFASSADRRHFAGWSGRRGGGSGGQA